MYIYYLTMFSINALEKVMIFLVFDYYYQNTFLKKNLLFG
jgi:hypothetical protein